MTNCMLSALKSRIALRLVRFVIVFSLFMTVTTTSIQLYMDYQRDLRQIDNYFQLIEESYLKSLSISVWMYDETQIATQLEGLIKLPDMAHIRIDAGKDHRWTAGHLTSHHGMTRGFPLVFVHKGKTFSIGKLSATVSLDAIVHRLADKAFVMLVTNGIWIFCVSGAILFLFQLLVTRHMVHLSSHLVQVDFSKPPVAFNLKRKKSSGITDELDSVTVAINQMQHNLYQSYVDLRVKEEQLRKSRKLEAIGTLAGGIAHDFNNILGIIIGNTELAMDDLPAQHPVRTNLDEVIVAGLRAKDVVAQLLGFTKCSISRAKPVDLNHVVDASMGLIRASLPATIELRLELLDHVAKTNADPDQIRQLLFHLCTNGVQAMADTCGILTVRLCRIQWEDIPGEIGDGLPPGDYLQLVVSDTGEGIAPHIKDRVFDPYFTTREVGEGSGMGLAASHGIVMKHGGRITIHSEPGKGTDVCVVLPMCRGDGAVNKENRENLPRGWERIIFVDDDPSILKATKQRLMRLGYDVDAISSPEEALSLFRSDPEKFDLLITDMTMPRMTGVALSEKVRAIRAEMPIIICTGHSSSIDESLSRHLGIDAYIMKPIDQYEMAKTIRMVFDKKSGLSN